MNYSVVLTASAKRQLRDLPGTIARRVDRALVNLGVNPRPHGVKKMSGFRHRFRIRVGTYRILYEVDDTTKTVYVVLIEHRRDAYK